MRRRFHGSKHPDDTGFKLTECKPGTGATCVGRLHFYALDDTDAEMLFDILDERYREKGKPG